MKPIEVRTCRYCAYAGAADPYWCKSEQHPQPNGRYDEACTEQDYTKCPYKDKEGGDACKPGSN